MADEELNNPLLVIDPVDLTDVSPERAAKLAERAVGEGTAFAGTIGKLRATLDEGVAKFRSARAADLPAAFVSQVHRLMAGDILEQQVAKHGRQLRKELAASSDTERTAKLRALVELEAKASTLGKLYESPQAALSRFGLGTEKRDRYAAQLVHAGPTELLNAARLALATNDRALGAAVMQLVGRVPKKNRLFSSAQLADALLGDEVRGVQRSLARVRHEVQRAIVENRAFERGTKVSPRDRIAAGLREQQLSE